MCPQFPPAGADANRRAAETDALLEAQASGAVPVWEAEPLEQKLSAVNQYNDSALFNGMIAPLVGYSVRAAIWDQGERNSVEGFTEGHYSCYFGAMINSWRDLWGIGDFAFIFAQLAPYDTADNVTSIRMAQYDTLARSGGFMDTTGMISQIDLGDRSSPFGSVHSRNKTEAGRRSALQMQHVMQGIQDISFSWAVPTSIAATEEADAAASVTVSFDANTLYNGTLRLLDAPNCTACCYGNTTFQVGASASGPWTNASAAVGTDGTTVVLTPTASAASPKFVRYAASNFPDCIITNNANIGTVPFVLPVGAALDTRSTRFDAHRPLLYVGADKDTLPSSMGGLHRTFKGVGDVTRPPLYWNSW
jgi:sialate O-acetylesterase